MRPVRIQRKRTAGFNLQEESRKVNGLEVVYVGRPTLYGNIFGGHQRLVAENYYKWLKTGAVYRDNEVTYCCHDKACKDAGRCRRRQEILDNLHELKGKNLACWCAPGEPCHADTLLELANGGDDAKP